MTPGSLPVAYSTLLTRSHFVQVALPPFLLIYVICLRHLKTTLSLRMRNFVSIIDQLSFISHCVCLRKAMKTGAPIYMYIKYLFFFLLKMIVFVCVWFFFSICANLLQIKLYSFKLPVLM